MNQSSHLFKKAQTLIPGGVNSPVRACKSVDCEPLFIAKGNGSRMTTEDGHELIDYVMSWGPLLLGHRHPEVTQAVHEAVDRGSSFGAPCSQEIELAESIIQAMPGLEMIRMVNSGTEASMTALRLARSFTQRKKILKFIGCYHGHVDSLLAEAGSGVATLCIPGTPGVPEETVNHTLLAPFNNLQAVESIFQSQGEDIAAVIVEPVAGNMGLVPPQDGFLEGLREITQDYNSLLIFDEVITGFRMSFAGAQGRFKIKPDLTCLGKIIGGGFPVGAFGGTKEVMEYLAPCGPTYQAGTLSGNPVAMTAGLSTLQILSQMDYAQLENRTREFASAMKKILEDKGVPVQLNCLGSAFTLFFTSEPVIDFATAKTSNQQIFQSFYQQMRRQNIYLAPSGFECTFTSFAHTDEDLQITLKAAEKVQF